MVPSESANTVVETPAAQPGSTQKRKRVWKKAVACCILVALAAGGAIGYYNWHLGSEARLVYKLGTSLNEFLGGYASAIKKHNVDAVLALYHPEYAGNREGDWLQRLHWAEKREGENEGVRVYLWEEANERDFSSGDLRRKIEELTGQIDYVSLAKFKIQAIEETDGLDSATLKTMLWLRGEQENEEKVELHVYIRLWLAGDGGDGWKIQKSDLLHGITVRGSAPGFEDETEAARIDFVTTPNPRFLQQEWSPNKFEIVKYSHGGVSTGDYNGDGWYDLFFCDGERSRLYRNSGNGTFSDVTEQAGLPDRLPGVHTSLFADLDNDGDPELFLARTTGDNRLFRNNGDGTFADVTATANIGGRWVTVVTAADYDNDGHLDLYLGRYLDPRTELPTTLFYTRNSEGNSLLRNSGDLRFTDVTEEAGVREGGLTLGISWGDYDADGNLDIYVANDFGRNALFRNEGDGTFTDVSRESGTADIGYGMSSSFADLDNDGDLDIYVSNVHSGQRWFANEATLRNYLATSVKQGAIREDQPLLREVFDLMGGDWASVGDRVIRGNSMFLNNGDGTFADVSEEYHVNPHGWYWGSVIFDYDNDGLQDIYALNGWISGERPDDL